MPIEESPFLDPFDCRDLAILEFPQEGNLIWLWDARSGWSIQRRAKRVASLRGIRTSVASICITPERALRWLAARWGVTYLICADYAFAICGPDRVSITVWAQDLKDLSKDPTKELVHRVIQSLKAQVRPNESAAPGMGDAGDQAGDRRMPS